MAIEDIEEQISHAIAVLIITYQEEKHIERCINSVKSIADHILVVDSYSTDNTVQIARKLGAETILRKFVSHSDQINFGISKLLNFDLIFRIDADEFLTNKKLIFPRNIDQYNGFYLYRNIRFMNELVRYGGVANRKVLRIFRPRFGRCEDVLMDEHIIVSGRTCTLNSEIIDDNLNDVVWWTNKHITYSERQAEDVLMNPVKYSADQTNDLNRKIFVKLYSRVSSRWRPFLYFLYRMFLRGGFREKGNAFYFHIFQAFWYRSLVEFKLEKQRIDLSSTTLVNKSIKSNDQS